MPQGEHDGLTMKRRRARLDAGPHHKVVGPRERYNYNSGVKRTYILVATLDYLYKRWKSSNNS
jgi:hypothetical protein